MVVEYYSCTGCLLTYQYHTQPIFAYRYYNPFVTGLHSFLMTRTALLYGQDFVLSVFWPFGISTDQGFDLRDFDCLRIIIFWEGSFSQPVHTSSRLIEESTWYKPISQLTDFSGPKKNDLFFRRLTTRHSPYKAERGAWP
ncbi:hypothetical protein M513_02241 [Trichuris suis]|uniref:Uncharacterized protein n=1 Tax=Trichuris suis TaxID=68888 RepID=A0A085MID8_9BILA|nr:hypothetical protein M513_02241 [Trichuris suis]